MDFDKVLAALSILEKVKDHPNLTSIQGVAYNSLLEENESARKELEKLAEKAAKEKAKADAEAAAEAKAQADKEAKANSVPPSTPKGEK